MEIEEKDINKDQLTNEPSAKTDNTTTPVKYSGSVTVTVKQGSRVISSRKSSNAGGENMFKFLAYCFSGDYSVAEELRPCKIMLFYSDADSPANARAESGNSSLCNFKYVEGKSIPADTSGTANTGITQKQWSTTYHFRIPYSWIRGTNDVYTVCLYGKSVGVPQNDSLGDFSAWYQFTKIDKQTGKEIWDPIKTNELNNTNIIIDWTVSTENK